MAGPTDTSERGIESLIVAAMTGHGSPAAPTGGEVRESAASYGGTGVGPETKGKPQQKWAKARIRGSGRG